MEQLYTGANFLRRRSRVNSSSIKNIEYQEDSSGDLGVFSEVSKKTNASPKHIQILKSELPKGHVKSSAEILGGYAVRRQAIETVVKFKRQRKYVLPKIA